jgi:hypothetical protein
LPEERGVALQLRQFQPFSSVDDRFQQPGHRLLHVSQMFAVPVRRMAMISADW